MRKRLIEKLTNKKKGTLGYTLTEMLVVVGIIAIACAIAIPSIISISKALKFAQANNYAKSIFLAAQQNLTELRSDGSLAPLQGSKVSALKVPEDHCGFPDEDWSDEYVYTASDMMVAADQLCAYDLVLPVNSVEGTVRGEHVIIEYNPITGNVYAVFYCEDADQQILNKYQDGTLPRDEDARRKMLLGYYDGSGLSSSDLDLERSQAEVEFTNGEEGVVTVKIPVPSHYYSKHEDFILGLAVELTITGDNFGGSKVVIIKEAGQKGNAKLDELATSVLVTYNLDSLADSGSFANLSVQVEEETEEGVAPAAEDPVYLSQLADGDFVRDNQILPGDNVTIQADVTFVNEDGDPAVSIRPGILAGINPMFDYLLTSPTNPDKFTLAVANGRNLQNLNAIHPAVADCVESVVFTEDINWNTTVTYYNKEYGTGGSYANNAAEAPGRALPYFVPIQNENLFGTAEFIYANGGSQSSGMQGLLEWLLEQLLGSDFLRSERVPTLTDELDTRVVNGAQIGDTHAKIDGQGHKVSFLNVDATQYQPCASTFYALGEHQSVDYYFAGLFGYVNTTINDLHVVNPIIKGHNFVNQDAEGNTIYMDPATGALVGAAGYNVLITNCSTYLDTTMEGFNWTYGISTAQKNYSAEDSMTWYGVSGEGAVGGLVGYAKSHRTVVGELKNNDTRYLAFANSFAAVPVSGNVRGNTNKDYGYSNGIGGFIGNSQLTNFYNCYSSGKVMARNTYYSSRWSDDAATLLGLGGNGRLAQGAGGFVGTSHGTRYTNCFSTSNVINNNGNAATGGFVGMMCYDATKKYGHHDDASMASANVAQHTVFDSCYATGMCTNTAGDYLESFSGANGKIVVSYGTLRTFYTGDYYKLLAPYALTHGYVRDENGNYIYDTQGRKIYQTPPYDELYIFKDSFYLSQYRGTTNVTQESSSKCAKPITYDELMRLQERYDDESDGGWIRKRIEDIKTELLDADDIEPVVQSVLETIFTDLDIGDILAGIFFGQENESIKKVREIIDTLWNEHNYKIYFLLDSYKENRLEDDYFREYSDGFPSPPWENATDATTHYYGEVDAGKVYPFPKLNTMDYYGLWPEKTLDAGLAYFEIYEIEEGTQTGYYFDRADTSTLMNHEDAEVVSDGYCVFTANATDVINVTVNGTAVASNLTPDSTVPITMSSVTSPDANSYYIITLPKAVMDAAADADGNYYHEMVITINRTKTITAYFNPNVALSQVNSATRPNRLPTAISIRSARQLAALAGEPTMWGTGYNYIQWLNINVDAYTASSFAYNEVDDVLNEIEAGGSIGNADHPFQGTYNGAGYAEVADIVNFKPGTSGIFGVIGEGGEVKNLDIIYNKEAVLTLGNADADNAAILAGTNQGTISDVTLTLDQEVELTAKTNAGLLVGMLSDSNTENDIQGGVMADCTLTVNENASVIAPNAGMVTGAAVNAVISGMTVTQGDESTFSAEADYVGGFAGSLINSDATDVTVALNTISAEANALGGFAGYAKSSGENTVSAVVVNLNNKFENTKTVGEDGKAVYAAGFAGLSDTVKYVNVTVNADDDIIGSSAAGMFGSLNRGAVNNARANIQKTVNGAVEAAGFAVELEKGDYLVQMAYVNLTTANSKVLSEGRAAGFAVEVGCTAMTTEVKQGAYGASNAPIATGTVQGADEAAGYACSITGEVTSSYVRGSGNIRSDAGTAAGFAVEISNRVANSGVTPAMGDAARNYRGNRNNNMQISGVNAAGFVANVADKNATVLNAYVLGTIRGTDAAAPAAAGFVLENNGTVDGSTANVDIEGGYAFAGTNNSLIQNCYGWYSDGEDAYTAFAAAGDGKILSSYFADLDIMEEEGADGTTVNSVVLYDYSGKPTGMLPSTLSGALASLNDPQSTTAEWYGAATYAARPYTNITPATYSYPMLRQHFGDWVTKPQYAYGVMYYELQKAADGSIQWKYNIMDLTDPDKTIEDESLSIRNDEFTEDGAEIVDAGCAVFCKSGVDPSGLFSGIKNWFDYPNAIDDETFENQVRANFVENVKNKNVARYSFYKITELGDLIFDSADQEGEIRVVTWYANAIGVDGTETDPFLIRTPEQFGYVGQMPADCFSQTHAIQASGFTNIADFTGTYDGNGLNLTVTSGNAWITTLNGTVQNVNLTVSDDVAAPIFGTVNGTLELDAVSVGSVSQNGALVGMINNATDAANETGGTATIGAITVGTGTGEAFVGGAVDGTLFGTVNGALETESISVGAVSGSIVNTVGATVDTDDINTGAVSGKLFGTIGANVNTGDITMASASGKVFEGASVGTTTLGDITVTSGDVSELFGAITGGTVSGNAINLSGNINSNLFASVSGGATVQNFAVQTSGSLKASLIGTVSGAEGATTTVYNVDVSAPAEATAFTGSGLLVNTLGDYTAVSYCNVASGAVTVKNLTEYMVGETPAYPFGGITGVVPGNATLSANTVDADMNVFGVADKLTVVGGMAAINSGHIIRGEVAADINYSQDTETVTDESGNITGYLYDKAGIGGLVGWMLPGAEIKGSEVDGNMISVTASGSINLLAESEVPEDSGDGDETEPPTEVPADPTEPSTEAPTDPTEPSTEVSETRSTPGNAVGREYFIGGAIAFDGGATYSDVTTAMVVSDAWAGGVLTQTDVDAAIVNPSRQGRVGKFVGFVSGGVFTDCSATDTAANFQFLGEIQVNIDTVSTDGDYNLYSSEYIQSDINTNIDWSQDPTDEDLKGKGYTRVEGNSCSWYDYPATLTDCTFGWTDTDGTEQTYTQDFDLTYFYGGTEEERNIHKAEIIGKPYYETAGTDTFDRITYRSIYFNEYTGKTNHSTDYYYYDSVTNAYYKVYLDFEVVESKNWIGRTEYSYYYRFKYEISAGSYSEDYFFETSKMQGYETYGEYKGPTLYRKRHVESFPDDADGTRYMIVTPDGKYALGLNGEKISFTTEFDLEANETMKKAVWIKKKGTRATYWQNLSNTSQYLSLYESRSYGKLINSSNNRYRGNISVTRNTNSEAEITQFWIKGDRYLTYGENEGFNVSRENVNASGFHVYRVTDGGKGWLTVFALRPEISEFCYATRIDENNNVIVLPTPAPPVVEETEEEQNVEETTEATEPSDAVTEPVTEAAEAAAVTEAATVPTEPSEPTSGEA